MADGEPVRVDTGDIVTETQAAKIAIEFLWPEKRVEIKDHVTVELRLALSGKTLATLHVSENADLSVLENCAGEALALKHRHQICMCLGSQILPRSGLIIKSLRHASHPYIDDHSSVVAVEIIQRNGLLAKSVLLLTIVA